MNSKHRKIDSTDMEICFFLYLPVEIIKEIIFYLSKNDKKTLRTVCKTIELIVNTTFYAHSFISNENSCEKWIKRLNKFPLTSFTFMLRFYTKCMAKIFSTLKTEKIYFHLSHNSNETIKIGKSVKEFILESNDDKLFQKIEIGESLKYLSLCGYQLNVDIIPTKNQIEKLNLYFTKEPATSFPKSFCNIFSQLKTINLKNICIELKSFIFPCLQNLKLEYCCWEFKDFDLQPFYNLEKLLMINCYSLNSDSSIEIWDFSKFLQLKDLEIHRVDMDKILLPPNVQHLSLFVVNGKIFTSKLSPLIESLHYRHSSETEPVEFDQFPPNLRKIDGRISFDTLKEIEAHYRINRQRKLELSLFNYYGLSDDQQLFYKNNFIVR